MDKYPAITEEYPIVEQYPTSERYPAMDKTEDENVTRVSIERYPTEGGGRYLSTPYMFLCHDKI